MVRQKNAQHFPVAMSRPPIPVVKRADTVARLTFSSGQLCGLYRVALWIIRRQILPLFNNLSPHVNSLPRRSINGERFPHKRGARSTKGSMSIPRYTALADRLHFTRKFHRGGDSRPLWPQADLGERRVRQVPGTEPGSRRCSRSHFQGKAILNSQRRRKQ